MGLFFLWIWFLELSLAGERVFFWRFFGPFNGIERRLLGSQ